MDDIRKAAYRKMLLDVSEQVNDDFLNAMKFYCGDIIKARERENIKSALALWTALEQRDLLRPDKLDFLKTLLSSCMRNEVIGLRIVEQYERNMGMVQQNNYQNHSDGQNNPQPQIIHVYHNPQQVPYGVQPNHNAGIPPVHQNQYTGPDLQREISYLGRSLGRQWQFFIRELGVSESTMEGILMDHRSCRERIHQCLMAWLHQEQENASRQKLVAALRRIQRNDLADVLMDGTF